MPTTNGSEISVADANEYIERYLDNYYDASSIGSTNVKSFIFDAKLLRDYLSNNADIKDVKFMLGARENPTSGDSLTLIMAGFDSSGDYVIPSNNKVLDHCTLCPPHCVTSGSASNDLIV